MLAKVCSKIFSILRCKISNIAFDFRIIKTKKWARQSNEKHPKIGPFKRVKIPKTRELPGALPHGPHQGPLSAHWTPRRYNALFATLATLYWVTFSVVPPLSENPVSAPGSMCCWFRFMEGWEGIGNVTFFFFFHFLLSFVGKIDVVIFSFFLFFLSWVIALFWIFFFAFWLFPPFKGEIAKRKKKNVAYMYF